MANRLGEAQVNLAAIAENPYPGRGISQGLNLTGETALQAYWVMGRSENSQNRILEQEGDIVRTTAYDESKVEDPSLIIYNAMGIVRDTLTCHIVSNGDQTDTIIDGLTSTGQAFSTSLKSREYEPDKPNYTPRISGIITPLDRVSNPNAGLADTQLSVIRKSPSSDKPIHEHYQHGMTPDDAGFGRTVHTYLGDGSPLPSFNKAPFEVPLGESVDDTAESFWESLDADNRVAIVVKGIHLATNTLSYRIINAHEE